MLRLPLPARSTASELLDLHPPSSAALAQNLGEMAALYRWSGGAALGWRTLRQLIGRQRGPLTLLDVAAGAGAGGLRLGAQAARAGIALQPIISDLQSGVLQIARLQVGHATPLVQADGLAGPWRAGAVDLVHCAQSLHHFEPAAAAALLRECARIARLGIVVVDLQRSWLGYLGARLAALGPMSALGRHDGPLSVLRAYTASEARDLALAAGLRDVAILQTPIYWALRAAAG
jgi:hypothetical protein